MHMTNEFTDLGAGWFIFEDGAKRKSILCDSHAPKPDHYFGPAAWRGATGPKAGKAILELHAVARGAWDQVGPEEWAWFGENGHQYSKPPASWPRALVLIDASLAPVFTGYAGRIFQTQADLIGFLRAVVATLPPRALVTATEAERLEMAVALHEAFESTSH
jgi:hypothetical protein